MPRPLLAELPASGDQRVEQGPGRCGHGGTPRPGIERRQLAAVGVAHDRAGLEADERRAQVVPGTVGRRSAVDEGVEGPVGDRAEIEGRGPERTELPPSQRPGGQAGYSDQGLAGLGAARRSQRHAVDRRPPTPHCGEGAAVRQVDHERSARTVGVDRTEARGEPRDAARCVGAPIERIDDHDHVVLPAVEARLLRQDPDLGLRQHGQGGGIGRKVAVVLAVEGAGQVPVGTVEAVERRPHRERGFVEQLDQRVIGQGHVSGLPGVAWQAVRVAAIDIAGFVSDLKDHAIDHGFHVHDERHFVETYSLRQTWEVDLHPEEACGGPLDLHLALEVDPRTLLSFEDVVTGLPEDDDPPDTFHFPLVFNWALPPLPKGPDLLILATELAGIGGTDLPLEVSAIDSFPSVTDAPERSLAIVSRIEVSLARVFLGQEQLCDVLDQCLAVSRYLLENAEVWLGDSGGP